jgi:hypothetical protein
LPTAVERSKKGWGGDTAAADGGKKRVEKRGQFESPTLFQDKRRSFVCMSRLCASPSLFFFFLSLYHSNTFYFWTPAATSIQHPMVGGGGK